MQFVLQDPLDQLVQNLSRKLFPFFSMAEFVMMTAKKKINFWTLQIIQKGKS